MNFIKKYRLLYLVLLLSLSSCFSDKGDDKGNPGSNDGSNQVRLSFSVSNSVAIAGSTSSGSSRNARADITADIVKINADGSIEKAIDFVGTSQNSNNIWYPNIAFMSIGEDKSVYICFQYPYQEWTYAPNTPPSSKAIQFVRVFQDNHYEIIWPTNPINFNTSKDGQVQTWQWWGMDSDPLVKDSSGKIYFKINKGNGGSNQSDSIWCYDPALPITEGVNPSLKTPSNATLSIESFKIDSAGHLFFKSASWSQNTNYLRFYTPGKAAVNNIYYSSSSTSMWVRGYVTHPSGNSIILNGFNIAGVSGIIRANIGTDDTVTYDLLYANANQSGGWIRLSKWKDDQYSSGTELVIDNGGMGSTRSYSWDPAILTAGVPDETKVLNRIRSYYIGPISFANPFSNFIANFTKTVNGWKWGNDPNNGNLWSCYNTNFSEFDWVYDTGCSTESNNEYDEKWWANWGVAHKISKNPEKFLNETINGKLLKVWLSENNMSTLDFNNVGAMLWASDGSLYGLYSPMWWGGTNIDQKTKVLRLLDSSGNVSLEVLALDHGDAYPSKIKIIGDYLYYRYAILDANGFETGTHKVARVNLITKVQEDITVNITLMEIISYDISNDNATMYFSGLDYSNNKVLFGKINTATKVYTEIPSSSAFNTIRVF